MEGMVGIGRQKGRPHVAASGMNSACSRPARSQALGASTQRTVTRFFCAPRSSAAASPCSALRASPRRLASSRFCVGGEERGDRDRRGRRWEGGGGCKARRGRRSSQLEREPPAQKRHWTADAAAEGARAYRPVLLGQLVGLADGAALRLFKKREGGKEAEREGLSAAAWPVWVCAEAPAPQLTQPPDRPAHLQHALRLALLAARVLLLGAGLQRRGRGRGRGGREGAVASGGRSRHECRLCWAAAGERLATSARRESAAGR